MKKDFAIRIFHNTTNKIEFLFWAEFFRLCGIFVGEGLLSDRVGEENTEKYRKQETDDNCFQFFLMIGDRESVQPYADRLPWDRLVFTKDIFTAELQGDEGINWSDEEPDQNRMLSVMDTLLTEISNAISDKGYLGEDTEFWSDAKTLGKIYLKYNLLLYSMNLQFYHYDMELLEEIEENYYKAYREIVEMNIHTPTVTYASLFCGYKANDAALLKGKPIRVEQRLLVKQCEKLCEECPEFINAGVLLGLIFSSAKENAAEAINAFEIAVEKLNKACFCSHIYYWIGNRWEQVTGKKGEAEKNYFLAYQRKPKYRNMYKLGFLAEDQEDFARACKYYRELIDRLEVRLKKDFADPLELHYYIKTCSRLGDLYAKQNKNLSEAAEIYEKGREAYERSYQAAKENRDFFVRFYGNAWEKYREVTDKTVWIEVIYIKALDIYTLLQNEERIQEYTDLLKKEKEPFTF